LGQQIVGGGAVDSEIQPVDPDREGELALEMSGLRDRIEKARHTMAATLGGGVAMTAIFMVGATFIDRSSTLWFLGVMWVVLGLRLLLINRASRREIRGWEVALESLANPPGGHALPHEP